MNPILLSVAGLAMAGMLMIAGGCGSEADAEPGDAETGAAGAETVELVGEADHSAFDAILKAHVNARGLVDYAAVKAEASDALDAYIAHLGTVDPERLDDDDRYAFYINLYNAVVIDEVLEYYEPGFSVSDDDFAFFSRKVVPLAGETVTLDELEKTIIKNDRPDDPRFHGAVVCAAVSCPPLMPAAFEGETLEETLDERMTLWLSMEALNRFDAGASRASLSQIFEWYADDFGGTDALAGYVNQYVDEDTSGWAVDFIEYDWTLNDQ